MPRPASAPEPPMGSAEARGPRFALRFEGGRGRLVLAAPLPFSFGTVDRLELELGPLRFPLDLSGGASRFRTRRTRVAAAEVRIDLPTLLARFVEEPYSLEPLAPIEQGLAFTMRDAFGSLALDALVRFEGARMRVVPVDARGVHEGPAPALVRAVVAARALGFALEEDRGALVVDGALSSLLMEALVPHGWRVPDDRAVHLEVEVLGVRRVTVRTREEAASTQPHHEAWERARTLAPVLARLTAGDTAGAADEWSRVRERRPDIDGSSLGFERPRGAGPAARCAALREAVREADVDAAADAADQLEQVEPSDAVAVEGLVAAADLAMHTRPTTATRLLERATARRPSDPRIGLRLVEAASRLGDPRELGRVLDAALATREPGLERARFAREAAAICELAGDAGHGDHLWDLAHRSLPHDARVLEGLGAAFERKGELGAALDAFDRAASVHGADGDPSAEAWALRRAARCALALDDPGASESRLTRAARLRDEAQIWAALVEARRALGQEESARRAEDRLLEAVQREPHPTDAVLAAVEEAVRQALLGSAIERAKAWHATLRRVGGDLQRAADLALAIERAELDARAADPSRLFELDEERCLDTIDRASNPGAHVREAILGCADPDRALGVLRPRFESALGPVIAAAISTRVDDVTDGARLLELAPHSPTVAVRTALLEAARARLTDAGDSAHAALALARLGVIRRDMAMLRAALTTAERAGAGEITREIVGLALEVVGAGPARKALEAMLERFKRG